MTVVDDWFSPDRATFGDRLAAAREAAGLSKDALAARVGVTVEILESWENDLAEPPNAVLTKLEEVLGQPGEWMVTGRGEGLAGPVASGDTIVQALDDLARVRGQIDALTAELGGIEIRLRGLLHG